MQSEEFRQKEKSFILSNCFHHSSMLLLFHTHMQSTIAVCIFFPITKIRCDMTKVQPQITDQHCILLASRSVSLVRC